MFTIQQSVADVDPVTIRIIDATGRLVYDESRTFNGQKLELQLDAINAGVYILQLEGSKSIHYNFKFVVNKS